MDECADMNTLVEGSTVNIKPPTFMNNDENNVNWGYSNSQYGLLITLCGVKPLHALPSEERVLTRLCQEYLREPNIW